MKEDLAVKILHNQLQTAHKYLQQTMEGVTDDVAHFMPPEKANPIAGTYAHLVFSEDFFIHFFLQQKQPLMETDWKDKTGASEIQPSEWETAFPKWLKEVKVDMKQFQGYAEAVFAASEQYVGTLKDADLEKDVDMSMFGMGTRKVYDFLSNMVIGHSHTVMGEVAVLKGIQGLKGYPF
jgi:hypothetical protein